jgi:hypothetical protein
MISENRHSNGARKKLSRSHNKAQTQTAGHMSGVTLWVFAAFVNASKTYMHFFQECREQIKALGCLRGSLSGKGQKSFTARIPAPGGDQ